jgi:hypothetical protein
MRRRTGRGKNVETRAFASGDARPSTIWSVDFASLVEGGCRSGWGEAIG